MSIMKKIIISLSVLFGCSMAAWADLKINETTFPDEYFRNWILAKDYGKDGVLTEEEIAGVTKITLTTNKIQSLKGIEYFTELTSLIVQLAPITEIDVSKFTKLTHLECAWTQITELDVSKNTELRELHCQDNLLTNLDISNNTALTTLSCNSNKLTSLDISNNSELTVLSCSYNQLTSLDVSKNTMLKRLICLHNKLASINVSGCTALESFRCSGNRLTELDVSGCSQLEELICMSNQIKGEAMDALVESLPTIRGFLGVINYYKNEQYDQDEQNVITKTQVAAAKAKGWYVRYNDSNNQWRNYEGSDDTTPVISPLGETEEGVIYDLQGRKLLSKPARGIYIEDGKKKMVK